MEGNQELIRREIVGSQLHTIQEERVNDFGTAISGDLGNSGDQSSLLEQQETDIGEKVLRGVELGGRNDHHWRFRRSSWGWAS